MAGYKCTALPVWDLESIFPSLESPEYIEAKNSFARITSSLLQTLCAVIPEGRKNPELTNWLLGVLENLNKIEATYETLSSFTYAHFSTATKNPIAIAEINAVEELGVQLNTLRVLFKNTIASRKNDILFIISQDQRLKDYTFFIQEQLFWQSMQMPAELEALAADLSRPGSLAWSRLQDTISSNASCLWDATGQRKTIVELRNLAYSVDRSEREKAWKLEQEIWKTYELALAASINGVKGFAHCLNSRRGWHSSLDKSIAQSRISNKTLTALLTTMEDSRSLWVRYLKAKATLLGLASCAFYDLFAPLPGLEKRFAYSEAHEIIVNKFSLFDQSMGDFADKAFAHSWIDAQPREGKVGGAYCTDFPLASCSRILCNYDGSFNALCTIAHELGHAYHSEQVRKFPHLHTQYPMTLAETASIFCETLVYESAIDLADEKAKISLVESRLMDSCQVIIDILSRYYFEKTLFERRAKCELTAEELCQFMLSAQKDSYKDGLSHDYLHPYMWAVKSHYYSAELSFYNFPYAFGLLFGVGLYSRYKNEGQSFARVYTTLLENTGRMSTKDLAATAGMNIESEDFWQDAMGVFIPQVEFLEEAAKRRAR